MVVRERKTSGGISLVGFEGLSGRRCRFAGFGFVCVADMLDRVSVVPTPNLITLTYSGTEVIFERGGL